MGEGGSGGAPPVDAGGAPPSSNGGETSAGAGQNSGGSDDPSDCSCKTIGGTPDDHNTLVAVLTLGFAMTCRRRRRP
jgi:hypothetical protein